MGLFELRQRSRTALATLLGASAIAYFGYHAVQGDRGIEEWFRLCGQLEALQKRQVLNRTRIAALEHRVNLLREEALDRDLLDERARAVLGLARPDEIIILGR
ncbi:MAG: septum formation initiator family protein [Alphaproteobacteria bacterium]|nr:septum formation initiator family protein [Alphaproteobacteria bacterium]